MLSSVSRFNLVQHTESLRGYQDGPIECPLQNAWVVMDGTETIHDKVYVGTCDWEV